MLVLSLILGAPLRRVPQRFVAVGPTMLDDNFRRLAFGRHMPQPSAPTNRTSNPTQVRLVQSIINGTTRPSEDV